MARSVAVPTKDLQKEDLLAQTEMSLNRGIGATAFENNPLRRIKENNSSSGFLQPGMEGYHSTLSLGHIPVFSRITGRLERQTMSTQSLCQSVPSSGYVTCGCVTVGIITWFYHHRRDSSLC